MVGVRCYLYILQCQPCCMCLKTSKLIGLHVFVVKDSKGQISQINRYAVPESLIERVSNPRGQVYFTVEVQTACLEFPEAASFVCLFVGAIRREKGLMVSLSVCVRYSSVIFSLVSPHYSSCWIFPF